MDINIESSEKAIPDEVVGIILVFCTSFMLSGWIALQLEISLFFPIAVFTLFTVLAIVIYTILWSYKRPRRTLDPPLLPRQSSHDSGYTSQYGSTDTPKDRIEITNDEWSCQLHALKAQGRFLQKEVEVLNKRAREAYQKHFKVSQFFLEHDAQKMASFDTNSHGFDVSRAWYAADLERTMKIKELKENQHRIKELRTEMQEHFWNVV